VDHTPSPSPSSFSAAAAAAAAAVLQMIEAIKVQATQQAQTDAA
jgi:hypothetical protein